ncbi:hypothetical protein TSUD_304860 [Trifolium subterraneum]|uniref:TF-B3 domain-containing protein n=1 Tax=Trifolium subterraneum TaxID=3900 RepID=A0A2Z6NXP2_TRISU|nr:hypothetical protein TSUD_304860 [Trifolium subterraneum]
MHPNPTTARDKLIAQLQVKYNTYIVEFDINEGAIMLPNMFARDFGNEVRRFATLVDPLGNQFRVLVEKIKGNVYLTWGWFALKNFYNIPVEVWVLLLYTRLGSFAIILKDRLGQVIDPPPFVSPIKFNTDLSRVGTKFVDDLPESTELLSYEHHGSSFGIAYEEKINIL